MTIAIDLDNTWTADPALWSRFYREALAAGHCIIMVTARRDPISEEERRRYSLPPFMKIIYTAGDFKEKHARAAGYKVDIWIDDTPGMIQECAILKDAPDSTL
jgi:hypothetical protein